MLSVVKINVLLNIYLFKWYHFYSENINPRFNNREADNLYLSDVYQTTKYTKIVHNELTSSRQIILNNPNF